MPNNLIDEKDQVNIANQIVVESDWNYRKCRRYPPRQNANRFFLHGAMQRFNMNGHCDFSQWFMHCLYLRTPEYDTFHLPLALEDLIIKSSTGTVRCNYLLLILFWHLYQCMYTTTSNLLQERLSKVLLALDFRKKKNLIFLICYQVCVR